MSDDKLPKPNGSGTDPMQRLASLKPSRDLSLGASKPNKKVFLPNLNVARNKNKGPSTSSNQSSKKEDRNRKDRKNDKNKNFRGPNVIKSSGVFSEGVGNSDRHSGRVSFGRDADTTPVMQKPTIRVKDFVKIDKELEEQKIRSVMGEGSIKNGSGFEDGPSVDFKSTTEKEAPIKLPMDDGCWSEPIPPVRVKQEVIVKSEPDEFETFNGKDAPTATIKREPCQQTEVVTLLSKKEPTLILLQLPDTLPGRGGGREEEPRRREKNEPSTSADTVQQKPTDNRCYLADLEEGRIGTLRTHRSGRVTLLLGETVFEVNMGTKPAFHQQVVATSCEETSRSAALVSLGDLHHKLSVVPHWEDMFKHLK